MRLAKPAVDVGLSTNRIAEHLPFWRDMAGLTLDEVLPIAPGHDQYRFDANASVLKVNHFVESLAETTACGIGEVLIAREGLDRPRRLADPDGARLSLVPVGLEGVRQIGIRLSVRDLACQRKFYTQALGLPEDAPGRIRAGETLILLDQDGRMTPGAEVAGCGWRYMTFQVFRADEAHAKALAMGATEARAPVTLGSVARFSIVRDPEGNAIELSQRASIVGTLD